MYKILAALFISLGFLVPALASAHSAPKPPKDTTPPSLTAIHISSSNANPSKAVPGDTITLSFTTSEKIEAPIVLVNARPVLIKAANTAGNSWVATYQVGIKDPTAKAIYALAMEDMADNAYACISIKLPFIAYCPPTDGSSVTIATSTPLPPPPPADTQAPVIAAHADVFATTTGTSVAVNYTLPTATDNVDASVVVSCTPSSGSVFSIGTTMVTCSAHDAAGNSATSTFATVVTQEVVVVVPPPAPAPYVMAGQADESYLCGVDNASWRFCDAAGTFSFTDAVGEGVKTIDLGIGSSMGTGTLQSVTIAKDPSFGQINLFHPWLITIGCFVDAAHTAACGDFSTLSDTAHNSSDGTHWSADFSALNRTFNPSEYYVMTIDDKGWETPAFGSQALQQPYWQMVGLS